MNILLVFEKALPNMSVEQLVELEESLQSLARKAHETAFNKSKVFYRGRYAYHFLYFEKDGLVYYIDDRIENDTPSKSSYTLERFRQAIKRGDLDKVS